MVEMAIPDCMRRHCDFDHEDSKPVFLHGTLAYDHNTKFGYKRFSSSEDNIRTNSEPLNLCCDPDIENSNLFFSQDTRANDEIS